MEDQPLLDDASPTALSLGYVADSDPEEDHEEDPANYPANGGDDADDESFDDDDDDDDDDEEQEALEDDDEKEEHLASTDSSVVHAVDLVPSAEETEPFKTDGSTTTPPPPPVYRTTSRMSIPSLSVPPPSPPTTSPTYAEAPLGYKAIGIWLRVVSPPTHHLSEIPLPPLLIPSTTYRDDLPEADMPLQKRARLTAPTGRFKIGESSSAATARQAGHTLAHIVDYGFIDTMNASIRASEIRAMTSVGVVNDRVTDLATTQRQDAQELYMHYEDAQDD
ncbi:hypothetical protein Tco_0689781 [Tanacetum coccineum]